MAESLGANPPPRAMVGCPPTYAPLLLWLIFVGLVLFTIFLFDRAGLIDPIIQTDVTRITTVVTVLLLAGTLHCGWLIARLSHQLLQLDRLMQAIRSTPDKTGSLLAARNCLVSRYLNAIQQRPAGGESSDENQLTAIFAERVRRQHDGGWFLAGALVKLGLLGTMIGFILMLRSVGTIGAFDISDVQRILHLMSQGMGVALYTTLVGLPASMVLGLQYLGADQVANRLVAVAGEFALRELPQSRGG